MQKTMTLLQYEEQPFRIAAVVTREGKAYTNTRYRPSDEGRIRFKLNG